MEKSLQPLPVNRLFSPDDMSTPTKLIAAIEDRLIQNKLTPAREKALQDYLTDKKNLDPEAVRGAIRLAMATPDYQLT
jgi:hypothetical protein